MSSDQHIEFDGEVVDTARGLFKVQISENAFVNARISGKIRMNKINVVQGDRVRVKVSTYDLSNGIITKRYG